MEQTLQLHPKNIPIHRQPTLALQLQNSTRTMVRNQKPPLPIKCQQVGLLQQTQWLLSTHRLSLHLHLSCESHLSLVTEIHLYRLNNRCA